MIGLKRRLPPSWQEGDRVHATLHSLSSRALPPALRSTMPRQADVSTARVFHPGAVVHRAPIGAGDAACALTQPMAKASAPTSARSRFRGMRDALFT